MSINNFKDEDYFFNWHIDMIFSPMVWAEDTDIHLLRDKVSKIKAKGKALKIRSGFSYRINDYLSIDSKLKYLLIDADGKQVQKNYKDEVLFEDIDATLESELKLINIGLSYLF